MNCESVLQEVLPNIDEKLHPLVRAAYQHAEQVYSIEMKRQRDEAYETAAKVAESQMSEPECPERAQYCADAIRALKEKP